MNLGNHGLIKDPGTQPLYVIMNMSGTTVHYDAATGAPWNTTNKQLADVYVKEMRKTDKITCYVVDYITALRRLAKAQEIDLKPPYTLQNITKQLIEPYVKATGIDPLDTGKN